MSDPEMKTILVVDDEPDVLVLVELFLEGEGYHVETAGDGLEALEVVSRRMPDLILLDIKMPVMDGPSFAREFHARYECQVPIVVLAATSDARSLVGEIGTSGWIGKPFDLDELTKVMKKQIRD